MAAINEDHQQKVGLDSHVHRKCAWGLVFANTVIESLTFTNGVSMQPENPNQNQITTFNAYTRSIVDVCGTEVMKQDLVPHTRNTDGTVTARPGPTGGVSRDAKLKEEMTKALIAKDVPKMAKIFLLTCPSDWDRGYGPAVRNMLDRVERDGLQPPERTWRNVDVQQYVIFNWKLAEIVDLLVDTFKLPMPGGTRCILWEDNLWQMRRKNSGFKERWQLVHDHWRRTDFMPRPLRDQGSLNPRFGHYLAAAFALSELSQQELDAVLVHMTRWMDRLKEFWKMKCGQDEGVLLNRREWQKEIGQ